MKRTVIIYSLFAIISLSSCYRQAYFVSPLNGNTHTYKTIPLQSEHSKQAWYVNNTLLTGSTNDKQADKTFAWQTSVSGANNFKNIEAFYGVGTTLGRYTVAPYTYDTTFTPASGPNYRKLNEYAGNYFFGSVDFNGGLNIVIPLDAGGEWRVVGIETSIHNEFGDFLQMRRTIPDSIATFVVDKPFFATLGGYTEIVTKTSRGAFGFKIGTGAVLGKAYHHGPVVSYRDDNQFSYLNFTFHATINKWTGYFQANFAKRAAGALFGVNFRLK